MRREAVEKSYSKTEKGCPDTSACGSLSGLTSMYVGRTLS